ncbi:MAG TPA: GNAT family N-acetyltransferase [Vicinamibacterales bacterium]|nr:GNAT family N-acetyltransferase [Vicinamibacterales bacterium]
MAAVTATRAAVAADADRLAQLRWEFRASRAPTTEDHDAFVRRCADWMRRELAAQWPWRAWVAIAGGEIVGQLWMQAINKMPNPGAERERHGYVSNVFVQPEHRGGAGSRLLDEAIAWARAEQVDRVILWPSARSVTLYERHGFTHHGDVMELALGPRRR